MLTFIAFIQFRLVMWGGGGGGGGKEGEGEEGRGYSTEPVH